MSRYLAVGRPVVLIVGARPVAQPAPGDRGRRPCRRSRRRRRPATESTDVDPIRCWWDADKRAVHIGEQFTLKITCSVVETSRDQSRARPEPVRADGGADRAVRGDGRHAPRGHSGSALALFPARIHGAPDRRQVLRPGRRHPGDQDHLQHPVGGRRGGAEGRDLTYILPPMPVRILSLVPKQAADIRDAPRETFADIEARRFRSTEEIAAAVISFGFAAVLVGLALVRVIGRYRKSVPAAERPLPARTILSGCVRSLARLRNEVARSGWTPELAGRALTAFRIAGAVALGRPVAQTLVDKTSPERQGQIGSAEGHLPRKRALVSAPTTVNLIDRHLTSGNGSRRRRAPSLALAEIREALRVFNTARYGRTHEADRAALDSALRAGTRAIRRLRLTQLWPQRRATTETFAKSAPPACEWCGHPEISSSPSAARSTKGCACAGASCSSYQGARRSSSSASCSPSRCSPCSRGAFCYGKRGARTSCCRPSCRSCAARTCPARATARSWCSCSACRSSRSRWRIPHELPARGSLVSRGAASPSWSTDRPA